MKSWKKPTPEQVTKAVALLGRAEQYRYFFDRLDNPEWISHLSAKGFFQNPPSIIIDEVRNTVRFPPWPESRYLARMAAHVPDTVHDVVLEIPFTENVLVQEDLVDAALVLPSHLASKLVPKVVEWIKSPYNFPSPEKLNALVVRLLRGQQIDKGFELAQVLFDVLPDTHTAERDEANSTQRPSRELRTYFFDDWLYERELEAIIPALVSANGERTLKLLCTLLDKAIQISGHHQAKKPFDGSPFWRPSIEEKSELYGHEIENALVTAIRDVVKFLAQNNLATVQSLVQQLESQPWLIFHRLALHLLRLFPNESIELIEARLTNIDQLETWGLRREYALLLQENFKNISLETQTEILELIVAGPDLEEFAILIESRREKPPTEEQIRQYASKWRRDRLALINNFLPEPLENQYDTLVKDFGIPKSFTSPEIGPAEVSWVGGNSPKTAEELESLDSDTMFSFLETWRPSDEFMGSTRSGLAQAISKVVVSDPGIFIEVVERFKVLHSAYVNAFLSGLRTVLKQDKKEFEWSPVLALCKWTVTQPLEVNQDINPEYEEGWNRVRQTIAELLAEGMLSRTRNEIKFAFRTRVWEILEVLTEDPEPTVTYEARYGGANMDPATLSFNTVRGQALHAVMRYAFWVKRHAIIKGEKRETQCLEEMPEVQGTLEYHLEPLNDPSFAIRAVYGQWFPRLVNLDSKWAKHNKPRIFPAVQDQRDLHETAWNAYIIFNRAYEDVFDILRDEYYEAIKRTVDISYETKSSFQWFANVDERLVQHLMAFYWAGKLKFDEPEGILAHFYSTAPVELRIYALRFIGQSLWRTEEVILPDILERLQFLWEWRFSEVSNSGVQEPDVTEVSAFGRWFTSGKFDDLWAMVQLKKVVELTGKIEDEHSVVKRLAELSVTMPVLAVECFGLIVDSDKDLQRIYRWLNHAPKIIAEAIQSPDKSAREKAKALAETLGRYGYSYLFRDLFSSRTT
jgi:hypothetical protein